MPQEYESEVTASREDVAAVLSGVVDGITAGSLQVGDEENSVVIDVPDELTLEVEVESEAGETSLELELEWSHSAAGSESSTGEPSGDTEDPSGENAETVLPVGAADASAALARFEVFRDRADEWRWRLRHRNGNVIATSGEGYTRKHNAQKGLRSVVRNAPDAEITDNWSTE